MNIETVNEIEQLAEQHGMTVEFVTWFFNEKKAGCGNVWFMMLAAMWEGWKGRSIEMDKLAAENVGLKVVSVKLFNMGYRRGHETTVESSYVDIHWSDIGEYHEDIVAEIIEDETPATDRIVAGIKADAEAPLVSALKVIANSEQHNGDTVVCDFDTLISVAAGALRDYYAKQLREVTK